MVLLLLLGGSMGSFLNVVVDRGSRGVSIVRPGSQCPNCGMRLRFGRENLPLLGWLILRGRCRQCRLPIPVRYLLMEWGVALAFVGVYQLRLRSLVGGTMDPWLEATGRRESAFFFLGVLALMSGFFAAGVIDFRTYHIPMWITTALALSLPVLLLAQGLVETRPIGGRLIPVPLPGWVGVGSAIGGALGALLANGLLAVCQSLLPITTSTWRTGRSWRNIRMPGERWAKNWCSARSSWRASVSGLLTQSFQHRDPRLLARVGVVWGDRLRLPGRRWCGWFESPAPLAWTRSHGTWGRASDGRGWALLGWFALLAFALAPFVALCWLSGLAVVQSAADVGRGVPPMPFGPHLAIATMAVVLGYRPIQAAWEAWFGAVLPWPQ